MTNNLPLILHFLLLSVHFSFLCSHWTSCDSRFVLTITFSHLIGYSRKLFLFLFKSRFNWLNLWHQNSTEHSGNVASTGFFADRIPLGCLFLWLWLIRLLKPGLFSPTRLLTRSLRESPRSSSLKTSSEVQSVYPWNIEVRHDLLEGPGLLCLLLVVQRDLLAELPGVGATCARGAGHRAGRTFEQKTSATSEKVEDRARRLLFNVSQWAHRWF